MENTNVLAEIDWAEIITAAASSDLGILALVVIAMAMVAVLLFRKSSEGARVFAFLLLFLGLASLAAAIVTERSNQTKLAREGQEAERAAEQQRIQNERDAAAAELEQEERLEKERTAKQEKERLARLKETCGPPPYFIEESVAIRIAAVGSEYLNYDGYHAARKAASADATRSLTYECDQMDYDQVGVGSLSNPETGPYDCEFFDEDGDKVYSCEVRRSALCRYKVRKEDVHSECNDLY